MYWKDKPGIWTYLLIGFGIIPMFGVFTGLQEGFPGSLMLTLSLTSAIPIAIGIWNILRVRKNNSEKYANYLRALRQYEATSQRIAEERKKIEPLERELRIYQQEKRRIERVLDEVYSANIIPSRYRDLYSAAYLYDWFFTGQSDDLDHALAMYVLEEIKARIDRVIEQQGEQLLYHRIEIANQQKSMEQQKQTARMIRSKLDAIQATEEERLSCDRMMAGGIATIEYLAEADYIKRIL